MNAPVTPVDAESFLTEAKTYLEYLRTQVRMINSDQLKTPWDISGSYRFAFQARGQGQCHRKPIHRKANLGNDPNPEDAEGYSADNLRNKSRSCGA